MDLVRSQTSISPISTQLLNNPNRNNLNEHKNVLKAIYIFIKVATVLTPNCLE